MSIVQCSRCGKEIDTDKRIGGTFKEKVLYSVPAVNFFAGKVHWDENEHYFCAECEVSFQKWLKEREVCSGQQGLGD